MNKQRQLQQKKGANEINSEAKDGGRTQLIDKTRKLLSPPQVNQGRETGPRQAGIFEMSGKKIRISRQV